MNSSADQSKTRSEAQKEVHSAPPPEQTMHCNCPHERVASLNEMSRSASVLAPHDFETFNLQTPDFETLARLQAEYLPLKPIPQTTQPCELGTAQELVTKCRIRLKTKAESLLDDRITPKHYFDRLLAEDCLADARRVLAHALPKRRSLWWACLCTMDGYQASASPGVAQAVELVTRFIHEPNEENRRAAEAFGRSQPPHHIENSLAMAAFFSGGSVSLPHLPEVPPRIFVTGRLVGVCVYLAAVTRSAAYYKNHLRQYLAIGREVATGQNLWYTPPDNSKRLDQGDADSKQLGMHARPSFRTRTTRQREVDHHA
jgi:hypothetical protein